MITAAFAAVALLLLAAVPCIAAGALLGLLARVLFRPKGRH